MQKQDRIYQERLTLIFSVKPLSYCQLHHVDKCPSFIDGNHAHPVDMGNKVIISVCDLLHSNNNLQDVNS